MTMTNFNLGAVIKKTSDKEKFVAAATKSVQQQTALIAETEKAIDECGLVQNINGKAVDMAALAGDIIERAGKRLTIADRAVFTFFNVQLNGEKTITKSLVSELFYAKKARIESDAESKTNLEAQLAQQKKLLVTIGANKALAESELDSLIEFLPEQIADALHNGAANVAKVYGKELSLDSRDVLRRVENSFFKFELKEGKRVNLTLDLDKLKKLSDVLSELVTLQKVNSGMSVGQRAALFSAFDKLNDDLVLFKAGELPDVNDTPVQASRGFSKEALEAASLAVPKEPVFKKVSDFFDKIDDKLVVNSVEGVEIINSLLAAEDEAREFSMLKAVKFYQKNPQAALIEVIDNFDLILQGYLNTAMQEFINDGKLSQLDRLFSSPTMIIAGQLTPYGRQVRAYIACVLPYVTIKSKGDGVEKSYFFEPVNFNSFSKKGISEKVGFYAYGVRTKTEKNGELVDARLPALCIRSHFRISKLLRDLKRADDKRVREENAQAWSEYRAKYGEEYTRYSLQAEIDTLQAALNAKTLELSNL